MGKWKSRKDREIPTFPQPIGWVSDQKNEEERIEINRPRVVYFLSGAPNMPLSVHISLFMNIPTWREF